MVGDAFEVGVYAEHGGDFAEITGEGVVEGQDAEGLFFDVDFELVDFVVAGDDFAGLFDIESEEGIDGGFEHADGGGGFFDNHAAHELNLNVDDDLLSGAKAGRGELIGGWDGGGECGGEGGRCVGQSATPGTVRQSGRLALADPAPGLG